MASITLGLVQTGDEVHEVNGIPVKGRTIEEVVQILVNNNIIMLYIIIIKALEKNR